MRSRRLWLLGSTVVFAVACAADPGDDPKDDAGVAAPFDAGVTGSPGTGGSGSDTTSAPPPGNDAMEAALASPAGDSSTPAVEASAPPPPSCTTCPLTVDYYAREPAPDKSSVVFDVAVANSGSMPQALSELTLRYWFTADGIASFTPHMYYAALSTITNTTIAETFTTLSATSSPPATATADTYMQISFTQGAGSIPATGSTNDIQLEFNDTLYAATQNEGNDYSHTASDTQANCAGSNNAVTCQTMTITLYRNGALMWGHEPGGAQTPTDGGAQAPADQ